MGMKLFKKKQKNIAVPRRRLSDYAPSEMRQASDSPSSSDTSAYASARHRFRRNQTFTGSTSSQIVSAVENDAMMQSPRAAAHHLRRAQRRLGMRLLGVVVLAGISMLILYQFIAVVHVSYYGQIATAGSDTEKLQQYESDIQTYLNQRPIERLRPFLNLENLAAFLQDNGDPEVREVTTVAAAELGGAQIVVKMREPVVTWTIGSNKQYVDKDGYIFTYNHYSIPEVTVIDESGVTASDDIKTVASSRFLQFIGRGVAMAKNDGLSVQSVIIPADTTRQVQFALSDEEGTRIKLSVDRSAGEQIEDAMRAYTYLAGQDVVTPYIDVRVSGRAYYS